MPETTHTDNFPLTTEDIFGPDITMSVIGELQGNPAYTALTPQERSIYRDQKLTQRAKLVDLIHTRVPSYHKQVERLNNAEALDTDAVLNEQELRLKRELEELQRRRRDLGARALDTDD